MVGYVAALVYAVVTQLAALALAGIAHSSWGAALVVASGAAAYLFQLIELERTEPNLAPLQLILMPASWIALVASVIVSLW